MRQLFWTVLLLCGCTQAPHYSYPPPSEAPVAPQPQRPAPAYVAPPLVAKPLGQGVLTARNAGPYIDGEERELRASLRGSGVGIIRPGDEIALYLRNDIVFANDALTPRAQQIVAAIAAIVAKYDSTAVSVNGYMDTLGAPDRAIAISQNNADAVARALREAGVAGSRITVHGLGANRLKIPTGPNVAEPRNRRVEIVLSPLVRS
jgi:outer membrane protein OmpA-like peptidoglycan-associated protein